MSILTQSPALRSLIWRLGRRLYRLARLEAANDPRSNGEYWLLENAIRGASGGNPTLLDIGANKGDWSATAASFLEAGNTAGHVHAFEPTSSTFEFASKRLRPSGKVTVHPLALSDRAGEVELFVVGDLAGTNSLYGEKGARAEKVSTQSVDGFLRDNGIAKVLMVKSDTEGHDYSVLAGGSETLRMGRVDVWQFEYNHRWVAGRHFLKDVFDLVAGMPYSVGRLHGGGVELYAAWDPELERFFETNYVLVRRGSFVESLCRRARFDASNVAVPADSGAA